MSEPTTPNEREALAEISYKAGLAASMCSTRGPADGFLMLQAIAEKALALSRTNPAVASTAAVPEGAEAVAVVGVGKGGGVGVEYLPGLYTLPAGTKLYAHPPRESGDAERYRAFFDSGLPVCFMGQEFRSKEECDKAIDAAIRSAAYQGKEGGGA